MSGLRLGTLASNDVNIALDLTSTLLPKIAQVVSIQALAHAPNVPNSTLPLRLPCVLVRHNITAAR